MKRLYCVITVFIGFRLDKYFTPVLVEYWQNVNTLILGKHFMLIFGTLGTIRLTFGQDIATTEILLDVTTRSNNTNDLRMIK